MGSGRFLAVFSRADGAAKPDPTAYARERLTALVESAADDDAKARCETIIDAEGNGSGCVPGTRAPVDPRHGFHIPVVRFATAAHPRIPADPRPPRSSPFLFAASPSRRPTPRHDANASRR